jgi:hypothetical protein
MVYGTLCPSQECEGAATRLAQAARLAEWIGEDEDGLHGWLLVRGVENAAHTVVASHLPHPRAGNTFWIAASKGNTNAMFKVCWRRNLVVTEYGRIENSMY